MEKFRIRVKSLNCYAYKVKGVSLTYPVGNHNKPTCSYNSTLAIIKNDLKNAVFANARKDELLVNFLKMAKV